MAGWRLRASYTAPVWAAVSAYAEEKGLRVLWLTRTASQVAHIASEIGCMPIYGRRLLCIHETVSKVEQRRFNAACRVVRLSGRCSYYPGRPSQIKAKTVGEIKDAGRKSVTCPYELQLTSMPYSTSLVATHKQLSVVSWLLAKWRWTRERTILVLDEFQNILKTVLDLSKDAISLATLRKAAAEAARYGFRDISSSLSEAYQRYKAVDVDEAEVENLLPSFEELFEAGQEIQARKLEENVVPASYVLSVADFKAALGQQKPLLVREGERVWLEALADPREELEKILEGWRTVIAMTATMDAELVERMASTQVTLLRAGWPFDDNLKAYIVSGLTTRYRDRDVELYEDVRWLIEQSHGMRTLVFLPSYEFASMIQKRLSDAIAEQRGMTQEQVEATAAEFAEGGKTLLAVFGGRLAEGINLQADLVMLVGIPFAKPSPRTKKLEDKLENVFGSSDLSRLHGLVLPALFAAVQAAGRAVRGPNDRALVLLVDDRYRRLTKHLPRWFRDLVSDKPVKLTDVPILLDEWLSWMKSV
ncbi:MAG: helicase C-terminal domain-containing protein [Candidatus Caldarchaeum sp.]